MSEQKSSAPNDFPRLNLNFLRKCAIDWIDGYLHIPIQKITLHRYSDIDIEKNVKYAIVFEVQDDWGQKIYERFQAELSFLSPDSFDAEGDLSEELIPMHPNIKQSSIETPEGCFQSFPAATN